MGQRRCKIEVAGTVLTVVDNENQNRSVNVLKLIIEYIINQSQAL